MSVELKAYKIKKIDMVNDLSQDGKLQISHSFGYECRFMSGEDKGVDIATVATLTEIVSLVGNEDTFHIALVLEGIFETGEIKTAEEHKQAHLDCYDGLFPIAAMLIRDLMTNSGMPGFQLEQIPMDKDKIKFDDKIKQ